MRVKQFVVATAGHVDHGKSALVKALTGIDPDRLPEEKARGITIDLGFAYLELPGTSTSSPAEVGESATLRIGIIDVPGHEDFVKNMVAGVGSIDLALLVVAADDGWMPQTEEHLQILTYLGVRRGVIALTKIDLVPSDETRAIASIQQMLKETPLADAPIVGVSAPRGHGIEVLKETLARVLSEVPPPRDIGKPRLPLDRVFTLRGIGTVVTGTIIDGTLARGQAVQVQPSGAATRIRSLQSHNREVESCGPGMRTALSVPDLSISERTRDSAGQSICRGEVITSPGLGAPNNTLDVLLLKSPRIGPSKDRAARPLRDGTRVQVHHGSGYAAARVYLLDKTELGPGEQTIAEVRFDSPVFAFSEDRFIVRDWAEQTTLAGGVVLDPDANRRNFRTVRQKKFLEMVAGLDRASKPIASHEEELRLEKLGIHLQAQLERDCVCLHSTLLLKSRFSAGEIREALSRLGKTGKVVLLGNFAADAKWWSDLCRRAGNAIASEHRTHPERPGLALSELRSLLKQELEVPELFEALLEDLLKNGFVQTGAAIRSRSHQPTLPLHLQAVGARLRTGLCSKPLEPPSRKELAPDALSQQALRFMLQTGEAVELGEDVVLLAENFHRAVNTIKSLLRERGAGTVSELRQALATSRRIMVPLLERLDRDGVTLRQGDKRTLKTL